MKISDYYKFVILQSVFWNIAFLPTLLDKDRDISNLIVHEVLIVTVLGMASFIFVEVSRSRLPEMPTRYDMYMWMVR